MFTVCVGTDVYNEVVKVEFESPPHYLDVFTQLRITGADGFISNCNVASPSDLLIETNHTNELPGEEQVEDDKPIV